MNKEASIISSGKFGEFITAKRKAEAISLRKLAELLNFSPAYWSDIEKGRRNPPNYNKLEEIAKIFALSEAEINQMIDLASYDRNEIPMDLPEYIKSSELVRQALRKARQMAVIEGKSELVEQAWRDFLRALEAG
ncbi:helix-turn-helix domain-containing protein [Sporotomaculum syntrophicum]|uniref:helix-turn-helix domain-containing protein n=1 Tax=Sporotomaculum syntrophicum TaxID=182264 RepID=UPI001FAE25A4|nr:helix-turn-helix transcriptional regulator [Sporotomaculum syntrophicum]